MFKWLGRRKAASGEEDDPILQAVNRMETNARREIPHADALRAFLESVPDPVCARHAWSLEA